MKKIVNSFHQPKTGNAKESTTPKTSFISVLYAHIYVNTGCANNDHFQLLLDNDIM